MLTFFEYLRQRAFESVLSGAQEALAFLESQQAFDEAKKTLPQASRFVADGRIPAAPKKVEDKSEKTPATSSDEPIPAPRDRGRPMNRSKESR